MGTIKERMKQNNVPAEHTIVTVIGDRMKQLYSQALSKFTQNLRFWDEYIKFLQSFKYTKDISSTFDRMLQVCRFEISLNTNSQDLFLIFGSIASILVSQ